MVIYRSSHQPQSIRKNLHIWIAISILSVFSIIFAIDLLQSKPSQNHHSNLEAHIDTNFFKNSEPLQRIFEQQKLKPPQAIEDKKQNSEKLAPLAIAPPKKPFKTIKVTQNNVSDLSQSPILAIGGSSHNIPSTPDNAPDLQNTPQTILTHLLQPKRSKLNQPTPIYSPKLCLGSTINVVLLNNISNKSPGMAITQTTKDAYDCLHEEILLPKGTRIFGENIRTQDKRIFISFNRARLPNGKNISIQNAIALDKFGNIGLSDQVETHLLKKINHYFSLFLLSKSLEPLQGSYPSANTIPANPASILDVAANTLNDAKASIQTQKPSLEPTRMIRKGFEFKILIKN